MWVSDFPVQLIFIGLYFSTFNFDLRQRPLITNFPKVSSHVP